VAGAAGVWYFFFSGNAPAAADIDEAAGALADNGTIEFQLYLSHVD